MDGTGFKELISLTQKSGIKIEDVFGDKAYFRKSILDEITKIHATAYIPVSEFVYRIDESRYSYNKDSDQWFCDFGNKTVAKKRKYKKDRGEVWKYQFDKKICEDCCFKEKCISHKAKSKILEISMNTPELYEYSQRAKTQEFIDKYKQRASQEWKNGEMKRFHGLDLARGYGLRSMSMQAKLTALAVNLKRIASLLSSNFYTIFDYSVYLLYIIAKSEKHLPDIS